MYTGCRKIDSFSSEWMRKAEEFVEHAFRFTPASERDGGQRGRREDGGKIVQMQQQMVMKMQQQMEMKMQQYEMHMHAQTAQALQATNEYWLSYIQRLRLSHWQLVH